MSFLKQELKSRKLPELLCRMDGTVVKDKEAWQGRREEIKEILCREFAGFPCAFPLQVTGESVKRDENAYGGKAVTTWIDIRCKSLFAYVSFPCTVTVPKGVKQAPVFVYISFTPAIADGIGEEIIDNGFAIANLYYQDVTSDKDDNFTSGAARFCTRNPYDSWGKLQMWGWAAARVVDVLEQMEGNGTEIDCGRIAVMGHSRLGKAALLAGAMDERFSLTVSNDSGGGGAALFRKKTGELIRNLAGKGSRFWFCGNFFNYIDRENELPFDQHFLLAMMAGRHLYVCSASQDDWADPVSEFLCCAAASKAFEVCGQNGLVCADKYPAPGEVFHDGDIGYHLREGTHYLGRDDWRLVMEYRRQHEV